MKYDDIITTVTSIVNDETIIKQGLTLVYELESNIYNDLNEEVFYKFNPMTTPCEETNEFEISIGGIIVKLIKIIAP